MYILFNEYINSNFIDELDKPMADGNNFGVKNQIAVLLYVTRRFVKCKNKNSIILIIHNIGPLMGLNAFFIIYELLLG